ncbi:MAG: hypothetical protein GAK38_04184 [Xylophilus sp.]|nr:MAG: hypothetical protein GAK38_04184 [Xylophilus sp.]
MFTRESHHHSDDALMSGLVGDAEEGVARHANRLQHIGRHIKLPATAMNRHKAQEASHGLCNSGMANCLGMGLRRITIKNETG